MLNPATKTIRKRKRIFKGSHNSPPFAGFFSSLASKKQYFDCLKKRFRV
jgi:hypothetical protein